MHGTAGRASPTNIRRALRHQQQKQIFPAGLALRRGKGLRFEYIFLLLSGVFI
jgi:hypothetical protein